MTHSLFNIAWRNGVWHVRRGLEAIDAYPYEHEAIGEAEWRERSAAAGAKRLPLPINHKLIGLASPGSGPEAPASSRPTSRPLRSFVRTQLGMQQIVNRVPLIGAKAEGDS